MESKGREAMKKYRVLLTALMVVVALSLAGCGEGGNGDGDGPEVINITAEEGRALMDEDPDIILVDVRTEGEYKAEHIPGALLVPVEELAELASSKMPDKEATYIVYCRTGNRSATAALMLIDMGYQKIYDMGGIVDWPYETESGL